MCQRGSAKGAISGALPGEDIVNATMMFYFLFVRFYEILRGVAGDAEWGFSWLPLLESVPLQHYGLGPSPCMIEAGSMDAASESRLDFFPNIQVRSRVRNHSLWCCLAGDCRHGLNGPHPDWTPCDLRAQQGEEDQEIVR